MDSRNGSANSNNNGKEFRNKIFVKRPREMACSIYSHVLESTTSYMWNTLDEKFLTLNYIIMYEGV